MLCIYCTNLTVSVYMFDYISAVISYSLIGVSVFLGKYDSLTPGDLAGVISKVSKLIITSSDTIIISHYSAT